MDAPFFHGVRIIVEFDAKYLKEKVLFLIEKLVHVLLYGIFVRFFGMISR